ncbi:hypothetical protein I4200191B4_19790 [Pseudoflavonifractor gallinarum]
MGSPQPGQLTAYSEISFPHRGHGTSAIATPPPFSVFPSIAQLAFPVSPLTPRRGHDNIMNQEEREEREE